VKDQMNMVKEQMKTGSYLKFGAMIGTSTVMMSLLELLMKSSGNNMRIFSAMWMYMTLVMASSMAVAMLLFMLKMYENKKINIAIILGSIVIFAVSLWLLRSLPGEDMSSMRAMIQ
jgi:hypothetical protein